MGSLEAIVVAVAALVAVGIGMLIGFGLGRELARRTSAEVEARGAAERAGRVKDELLATVSHELRTPLNAIVGWVHLLNAGSLSGEDAGRALEAIERNARAETRLVSDLLDEASLNRGLVSLVKEPCEMETVVRGAVNSLTDAAQARAQHIEVVSEGPGLVVIADRRRLGQVVWNLVANAIKFTPFGGRIRVEMMSLGDAAQVRVIDSGQGIEPEFLPRVFEPFRQGAASARRVGLGLGLSLVKQIVELHGGRVDAESAGRGHGATFTVTVPAANGRARQQAI